MKPDQRSLLLHPVFITGVALMLVNDLYWKYEYHNWFTGKLSDIAGMTVLPVFLTVLFPRYKKTTFIASAIFFIVWKSPFVQPVIDFANAKMNLPVGRTVDYTDLICLAILPLVYRLRPWQMNITGLYKRIALFTSAGITIFTLCSTTMASRYLYRLETNDSDKVSIDKGFRVRYHYTGDHILNKLKEKGIDAYQDTARYDKLRPDDLYADIKDSSGTWRRVKLEEYPNIALYRRFKPYNSYTIPLFVLGSDTLRNINFSLNQRTRKGVYVQLYSFEFSDPATDKLPNIKRDYGKFFAKPLAQKLEELLKQ